MSVFLFAVAYSYISPMTHAPETGAINRLNFSGADFWYVCRANIEPDSSATRFRRRLE